MLALGTAPQVSCADCDRDVQHGLVSDPFFQSHCVFMDAPRQLYSSIESECIVGHP